MNPQQLVLATSSLLLVAIVQVEATYTFFSYVNKPEGPCPTGCPLYDGTGYLTLYHATNKDAAQKIKDSGTLKPGHKTGGRVGDGIYLAFSKAEAKKKSLSLEGKKAVFEARVALGCTLVIDKIDDTIPYKTKDAKTNKATLNAKGCDSILLTYPGSGHEICVYDEEQIEECDDITQPNRIWKKCTVQ